MAGHTLQIAKDVRSALVTGAGLKALVDELYSELGTFTEVQVIDTGAGGELLVVRPGYGPLSNPTDYVYPAQRHA